VREVYIDDESKEATVIVPDDQLALAIGKEGLNARLAARLTGWRVDIQSETEFAHAEAEAAFAGGGTEEEFSGRCAAILANGKRCPNTALSGSRFCGVPAHQELAKIEAETGTFAAGTVQPAQPGAEQEAEDELPGEGEEAAPDDQVAEQPLPEEVVEEVEQEPEPEPEAEPQPEPEEPVAATLAATADDQPQAEDEEPPPAA
jgi:transcription termination/antitermination protein NusA